MRFLLPALLSLCATTLSATPPSKSPPLTDSTNVYIQPISTTPQPITLLSTISYNPSTLSSALTTFSAPSLPPSTTLLRVGIYDPASSTWKSSTTVTSIENFTKGYAPTITLTLDLSGSVVGAALKSAKVDAGETRDFGPKVRVVRMKRGKGPGLNTPVVLSPEGKVAVEEVEKTLLQK